MIPMRLFPLAAAAGLAGALAACVATGPAPAPQAPPPAGQAVETRVEVSRDGAPFGSLERTLWRARDNRLELDGPAVLAGGAGHGLELWLRPDFNLAGEFWGELTAAEFDVLEDGTRVHYLGMPHVFRLQPTVTGAWGPLEFTGRSGAYSLSVECDWSPALKAELLRRGD